MRSGILRVAPVLVAMAVLMAACGSDDGTTASQKQIREFRAAVDGLCQTANTLGRGETSDAIDVFQDRTHVYLHELIDRVEPRNRDVATRLLEAKQAVETALKDPAFYGQKEVGQRFGELHEAMIRAGRLLGLPEVGCGA